MEIEGWKIYQLSYDESKGGWSDISIFELVRDPWLPVVYTGIVMMMLGAVCLFVNAQKRKEEERNELGIFYIVCGSRIGLLELGGFAAWKGKKTVWAYGFTLLGLAVFFCFILGMWVSLERPPMRTMGRDTFVVFFLSAVGWIDNVYTLEV